MSIEPEDRIIPIPYANERDRRIYEPGYFHTEQFPVDAEYCREQREKFYRMEEAK